MSKLTGKIAVVTGVTGGLGQIVAQKFIESGATVIGTHNGSEHSTRIVDHFASVIPDVSFYKVDATSSTDVKEFFKTVEKRFSTVHILCNLVGGVISGKVIEDLSDEEWNSMMDINLKSAFFMIREAVNAMKKSQFGRIISIGARPAVIPEAGKSAYASSKAALMALTQTIAEEFRQLPFDCTANVIVPSIILTEANKSWGTEEDQKKWVPTEDIADMIVYLCSTKAKTINGQFIQMYGKVL